MTIFVAGEEADLRGFALAGIPGLPARSASELEAAVAAARKAGAGVLFLSAALAARAPGQLRELERNGPLPLVLPQSPAEGTPT